MLNRDAVGREFPPNELSWTSKDAILYALGVGSGSLDPLEELQFTTENSVGLPQRVLPTFAVVLGGNAGSSGLDGLGDFSLAQVMHGEQKITLHRELPREGTVTSMGRVAGMFDKGKHANIVLAGQMNDAETGELLVESETVLVVRGEGGFGGDPGTTVVWAAPERTPDHVVSYRTRPDQALLYRLSGDRNPLHSDPSFAAVAGLERPILHGLCTYGFTGRALMNGLLGGDPAEFGSMAARFAAMVYPGDVLEVRIWETPTGAVFQTWRADDLVLDRGVFERAVR